MARKQREIIYWAAEPAEIREPCCICDRMIEVGDGDEHHLIPRQKGGRDGPTVHIHRFCHTKIHATFTNYELAKVYSTPEAIRAHPIMADFITWVADKPSDFYMKNAAHNERRNTARDKR